MSKLLAIALSALFATSSFAASHAGAPMTGASAPMEAQKAGSPKAQAAAQAKTDAKAQMGDKSATQPQAQMAGSEKAQANAGMKKKAKHKKSHKSRSTATQMNKDAQKL
jgi:hypothetical protein